MLIGEHAYGPTPTREHEAMTLELRHLGSELHVPLTAHVIVTPWSASISRRRRASASRDRERSAFCA
ncbi:hypothetical protein WME89_31065 [Sorangium sp. So ce321]|uniref:hypothetical protein n=1 Tax=Sorangium sp. So ce321 TaxID=3133300 RepID=UPI003F5E3EA7